MPPIVARDTVVPVRRMEEVRPVPDFADRGRSKGLHREARLRRHGSPLGRFDLSLSPDLGADRPLEVRFTYDVNGILEMSAR